MTTYQWATIRADAIARFGGDSPRAELEQHLIGIFEQQPQLVVLAIDKIADSYRNGSIRSPWAVLKTHLDRASQPGADIQVTDTTEKQKRIQHAEQWIRAAGIHYDRDTEIMHELFGDLGALRPYAQVDYAQDGITAEGHPVWTLTEPTGDTALVERMLRGYHDARPTGIQLETEADQRAADWKTQQQRMTAIAERVLAELDAKQDDHTDDLPL